MNIEISRKNEGLINRLVDKFELSPDDIVNNIIVLYRARKRAEEMAELGKATPYEFMKYKDKLVKDEDLYIQLLAMYRIELEKLVKYKNEKDFIK